MYEVDECSEDVCVAVLDWLSSNQIDVHAKYWYRTVDENLIPQLQVNKSLNPLLHWIWKLKDMLSFLLKCNNNIQFIDENGKTILHAFLEDYLANYEGQLSFRNHHMIQYLMCKGVSVNAADKNGNTPVHIAAKLREIYVVEIMLDNYVNVNACNNQGDTVLHILFSKTSDESTASLMEQCVQSMLSQYANVNIKNNLGWTPVHLAAKYNYFRILKNFLHAAANLNLLTNNGESPLLLVCKYAPLYTGTTVSQSIADSVLKPLVEAGADVNVETVDGTTPLHLVTLSQLSDAVEYLIAKGANVSHREKIFGFTALHMAAMQHCESKLEYLLRQGGLDVNDGGYYGITALHLASFHGNVQFMSMLIDHGADVRCRERESRSTTLHFVAKDGPVLDYISLICNVDDEPFWNPRKFIFSQSKHAVQLLVDRGVDVNAKDACGRTPLHVATKYVFKEGMNDDPLQPIRGDDPDDQIRALLNNGAHMDVEDYEGNLPIHNALITRHEEALKSLLEFGVDVNEGDTCRIVMNSCEENMKTLVIEYLVKLRVAKLPVSDAYTFDVGDTKLLENEVKQMQSHLLDDTTSLYDLLHMGWRQRSNFKPKLPNYLKEKFPLYAGIIRARCRDAEQKRLLFKVIHLRWHLISEVILPEIVVDFILELLGIRNLRVLVEALS